MLYVDVLTLYSTHVETHVVDLHVLFFGRVPAIKPCASMLKPFFFLWERALGHAYGQGLARVRCKPGYRGVRSTGFVPVVTAIAL